MTGKKRIPLVESVATKKLKAITQKYQLPMEPSLGDALDKLFFRHQDLWSPDKLQSKTHKRSATKIHKATKKYMSVLSENSTFAKLLCAAVGHPGRSTLSFSDVNTLTTLLKRLLINSSNACRTASARGRGKDPLAITVSDELGILYDHMCPPSPRLLRRGESRNHIKTSFIRDAAALLGIALTEDTIRTYGEKKHKRRIRS